MFYENGFEYLFGGCGGNDDNVVVVDSGNMDGTLTTFSDDDDAVTLAFRGCKNWNV